MNKIFITILVTFFLTTPGIVIAQGSQGNGQNGGQNASTESSAGPQTNQNQIQVQNQGEETQLRTSTQYMQQLMNMEGLEEEVGNKVRTLAQEQIKAESQIQTQVNKLESKSGFMKKLFGPDYRAIKNLNGLIEQNRLRIETLTQLANQVQNEAEETQLQEAIQALTQQNTALQEQVQEEEKVSSLFGWLIKLFS